MRVSGLGVQGPGRLGFRGLGLGVLVRVQAFKVRVSGLGVQGPGRLGFRGLGV